MSQPEKRVRRWYQWHLSTLLLALLPMGFFLLMSAPAKFVDSKDNETLAVHGWPFVHLARSSRFVDSAIADPSPELKWVRTSRFEGVVHRHSFNARFSFLSPAHYRGYWDESLGKAFWSATGLGSNIAVALGVVLVAGSLIEWRRRRRKKFYHLAIVDLLLLISLPAFWFGYFESAKKSFVEQDRTITDLKKLVNLSGTLLTSRSSDTNHSGVPEWLFRASNGKRHWLFKDATKSEVTIQMRSSGNFEKSWQMLRDREPDHEWPIATRNMFSGDKAISLGFRSYAKPQTDESRSEMISKMESAARLIDQIHSVDEIQLVRTTVATSELLKRINPSRIRHLSIEIVGPPHGQDRPEWMLSDLSFISRFKNLETLSIDCVELKELKFEFPVLPKLREIHLPSENLNEETLRWLKRQPSLQLFSDLDTNFRKRLRYPTGSRLAKLKEGWILPNEPIPVDSASRIHRLRKEFPTLMIKTLR